MLFQKIMYHSGFGYFTIVSDEHYIRKVSFGKQEADKNVEKCAFPAVLTQAEAELTEYFDGKRTSFDVPVSYNGTKFSTEVWDELQNIPFGEKISYQELAIRIGRPKACRAVGGGCHRNQILIIVPCHRVVGANGSLTGFGGGLDLKEKLLSHEQSALMKNNP